MPRFCITFICVGDTLRVVFLLYAAVRITLALWAEGVKSRPDARQVLCLFCARRAWVILGGSWMPRFVSRFYALVIRCGLS